MEDLMRRSNDEEAPRKSKRKKDQQKTNRVPLIIGVSVLFVISVAVVIAALVVNKKKPAVADSSPPPTPGQTSPEVPPIVDPLITVDVSGPFPQPGVIPGVVLPPDESLLFHIVLVGITYKLDRELDRQDAMNALDYFNKKIGNLIGPNLGGSTSSKDAPNGTAVLATVLLGRTKADPNDIAKRIDFGTVRGVSGRTITLVLDFNKADIPRDPSAKPAPAANPRTINDPSRYAEEVSMILDYVKRPQLAETRFTGKQLIVSLGFMYCARDDEGRPCVLAQSDEGKRTPSIVARLVNEGGWKEGKLVKGRLLVEGRVVGALPLEELSWMKSWTGRDRGTVYIPGKVIVIEDAKLVLEK
jgi:hypothetical protein